MDEITVSGTANPHHYAREAPMGYEFIGVVTRNGTDTGALAVASRDCYAQCFGQYVQCNAGSIRMLPQMPTFRAVLRALDAQREEG